MAAFGVLARRKTRRLGCTIHWAWSLTEGVYNDVDAALSCAAQLDQLDPAWEHTVLLMLTDEDEDEDDDPVDDAVCPCCT